MFFKLLTKHEGPFTYEVTTIIVRRHNMEMPMKNKMMCQLYSSITMYIYVLNILYNESESLDTVKNSILAVIE